MNTTVDSRWDLWCKLRAEPEILPPHPTPRTAATPGDWLTEFEITTWPPAPEGWRLTQYCAEGNGIHASRGTPLGMVRSVALVYYHPASARGATAVLHFKAGARKGGGGSWRFAEGFRWQRCTCEHDRRHLAATPQSAGADEIKALLQPTEGTGPQ